MSQIIPTSMLILTTMPVHLTRVYKERSFVPGGNPHGIPRLKRHRDVCQTLTD